MSCACFAETCRKPQQVPLRARRSPAPCGSCKSMYQIFLHQCQALTLSCISAELIAGCCGNRGESKRGRFCQSGTLNKLGRRLKVRYRPNFTRSTASRDQPHAPVRLSLQKTPHISTRSSSSCGSSSTPRLRGKGASCILNTGRILLFLYFPLLPHGREIRRQRWSELLNA